jgi:hypothetical protein
MDDFRNMIRTVENERVDLNPHYCWLYRVPKTVAKELNILGCGVYAQARSMLPKRKVSLLLAAARQWYPMHKSEIAMSEITMFESLRACILSVMSFQYFHLDQSIGVRYIMNCINSTSKSTCHCPKYSRVTCRIV